MIFSSSIFDFIEVLKLGELFHDELFGLFEAMSAIEMMDPKMDAGMLCNRGGKPTLNFDQALAVSEFHFRIISKLLLFKYSIFFLYRKVEFDLKV